MMYKYHPKHFEQPRIKRNPSSFGSKAKGLTTMLDGGFGTIETSYTWGRTIDDIQKIIDNRPADSYIPFGLLHVKVAMLWFMR